MPRSRPRSPLSFVPAFVLILALGAWAPSTGSGQERTISLNKKNLQIKNLIQQVGEATGRTILFDEQVRGSVSIVTKRPVTLNEAWMMLDTSLSMLGYSLLPSTVGNWRIAKIPDALGEAPFAAKPGTESESFVTTLIALDVADLQDVLAVLQPLSGSRVTIVPFEPTRSFIVSGPEREIARLTTIANELDHTEEADLRLRVLRYRDVGDVEPMIEAFLESDATVKLDLEVWSDQRTNAVLYRGSAREVERLASFIDRIDRPIKGEGEIRVLRVLNRDAEEVAELIRGLGQSAGSRDGSSGEDASPLADADFEIAVEKASRSLVVRADTRTHEIIRETLERIDELPQLIAIDITVSELRTPSSYALGFAFSVPLTPGNDTGELLGRLTSAPRPGGLLAIPTERTSLFGRLTRDSGVPFTIEGGDGIEIPIEDTAVIEGEEFSARNNVLLQPSLIVVAGERHEIFVGENVPIPVSGDADEPGGDSVDGVEDILQQTTTIDRKDIGIRLTIEPRAGREGRIQLELEIEITTLEFPGPLGNTPAGNVANVGPSYLNRSLNVTAHLDDGETAIIAMDREAREFDSTFGTPWLSQIPFLRWLFTTNREDHMESRLIISARARRVSSPAELVADTIRRRLAFQRSSARGATLEATEGAPFGVRVTTRSLESDAIAIAEGLSFEGYPTKVHKWTLADVDYYDVYIISFESMADAAEVATRLSKEGWEADLVVLPTRS